MPKHQPPIHIRSYLSSKQYVSIICVLPSEYNIFLQNLKQHANFNCILLFLHLELDTLLKCSSDIIFTSIFVMRLQNFEIKMNRRCLSPNFKTQRKCLYFDRFR